MNTWNIIGLVIIIVSMLIMIAKWSFDWGFQSASHNESYLASENKRLENENNSLGRELIELKMFAKAAQDNTHNLRDSYSKLMDDMLKIEIENVGLVVENKTLKKEQSHNNYNLKNEVISLHIENQRLKDTESKNKIRIKELEGTCEPKFEDSNREKIESLRKIIEPIEEWINENACPHDKLIITQGNVEFTSGEFGIPLKIKD